jgi:hypothetical protein
VPSDRALLPLSAWSRSQARDDRGVRAAGSLYDIVGTEGVGADLSHINTSAKARPVLHTHAQCLPLAVKCLPRLHIRLPELTFLDSCIFWRRGEVEH